MSNSSLFIQSGAPTTCLGSSPQAHEMRCSNLVSTTSNRRPLTNTPLPLDEDCPGLMVATSNREWLAEDSWMPDSMPVSALPMSPIPAGMATAEKPATESKANLPRLSLLPVWPPTMRVMRFFRFAPVMPETRTGDDATQHLHTLRMLCA